MIGSNLYVWFSLAMLIWMPVGTPTVRPAIRPDGAGAEVTVRHQRLS